VGFQCNSKGPFCALVKTYYFPANLALISGKFARRLPEHFISGRVEKIAKTTSAMCH